MDAKIVWRRRVGAAGTVAVTAWVGGRVAVIVRSGAKSRLYRAFEVSQGGEKSYDLSGVGVLTEVLSAPGYPDALKEATGVAMAQWVMQG
jgi:hypothetical protein